jgi:uncharacterized repeat protein (TIGR01451 family)
MRHRVLGLVLVTAALLLAPAGARAQVDPCPGFSFEPSAGYQAPGTLGKHLVGDPFYAEIKVSGYTAPYTWQHGTLPGWLSWSTKSSPGTTANDIAVLQGTPTTDWFQSLQVNVIEPGNCNANRIYNWSFGRPPSVGNPAPRIDGTAAIGENLNCLLGGSWNGTPPISFKFQWFRDETAITELLETNGYEVTPEDANQLLRCTVLAHNDFGDTPHTTDPVFVETNADLAVDISGPTSAVEGQEAIYTVTVRNDGPDPAGSIVLDLTHDPTVTVVSVIADQGPGCSASQCELGALLATEQTTVVVKLEPAAGQGERTITESAAVTSGASDPDPLDDADGVQTSVTGGPAELVVSPAAIDFGRVAIGKSATREVTLQNTGASSLTFQCHTAEPFSFPQNVCGADKLAAGASTTVHVTFTPAAEGVRQASFDVLSTGGSGAVALTGEGVPNLDVAVTLASLSPVSTAGLTHADTLNIWGDPDDIIRTEFYGDFRGQLRLENVGTVTAHPSVKIQWLQDGEVKPSLNREERNECHTPFEIGGSFVCRDVKPGEVRLLNFRIGFVKRLTEAGVPLHAGTAQLDVLVEPLLDANPDDNVIPRAGASRPSVSVVSGAVSKQRNLPQRVPAAKLEEFSGTSSIEAPPLPAGEVFVPQKVQNVEVAVVHYSGGAQPAAARCRFLRNARAKFKTVKPAAGRCQPTVWLKARGTRNWRYRLRKRLPKGRYVLYSRAVNSSGIAEGYFDKDNRQVFRVT